MFIAALHNSSPLYETFGQRRGDTLELNTRARNSPTCPNKSALAESAVVQATQHYETGLRCRCILQRKQTDVLKNFYLSKRSIENPAANAPPRLCYHGQMRPTLQADYAPCGQKNM